MADGDPAELAGEVEVGIAKRQPGASVAAGTVLEEQAGRTAVHHLACASEPEAGAGAAVVRFLGAGAAVGVGDEEGPIHLTGDGNFHRLCRDRDREGAGDGYSKCLLGYGWLQRPLRGAITNPDYHSS